MPIKVDLHDSTSQVKVGVNKSTSEVPVMPGGESISDKRLEALLKKEIKDRIAGDEHLQEEIDELVNKGARYILIEEKEDGSIDVSLLNEREEVLSTQTIHLTEKIIKESVLDYEHSKIIYTCNDNSTIELDISDIVNAINTVANDLNSEIERATTAEEAISQDLADEVSRATNEEARIEGKVDAETTRAEHAEQELTSALEAETDARMSGDSALQDNIDAEASARADADTLLQNNIDAEATTRSQEITRVEGLVALEEGRAKGAERTLQTNIESEATTRAAGDADLAARLSDETNRAFAAENAIQIELDTEEEARAHADDVLQGNIDAEETRAKGVESSLNTAIGNETTRATGAEQALGTRIDNLDLSAVGSDGGYIKTVSQTDGQVGATRQAFDTTVDASSDNTNAPTSKAVKDYVDAYGGKIDSISIDGVEQQIVNKNVDLPAYPTRESLSIDNVDNTSDLNKPISTATQSALDLKQDEITSSNKLSSDLVDDTNHTHKFATQSQLDQIATNQSDIGDLNTALTTHTGDTSNPHSVTASQVGLGSVVNTGDSATPTQGGTTKFTTGGAYTLKTDLETAIGNVDDKLNQNVHTEGSSDEISYNGDTVTKTSPYINLKTGTTGSRSEVIHLANSTTAGLMSHTDYNQIRDNTDRIAALEGTPVRLIYTASQNPTASDIKTFVDNYLAGKGIVTPTDSDYNSVSVKINGTNHIWNYYANDGAYKDDGLDTVTAFTNSIAGIILGSSNDGQVYAENDGTGSVYGWSALKTRVGNNETNITSLQNGKVDKVSGKGLSTNDFTDALKTKLDGIATGAEVNTIVGIQKNGTDLTPDANRKVNISVPTKTSDLNNDSDFATNTYVDTELAKKQNTLDTQTAYTSKGSATKVPQITTNTLGQVTSITEVTITDNNDNQKVKAGNVTFGDNDVINFVGGGNTTVTGDASGKTITISSSDSHVGDVVSVGATSGSNIAIGGTSANPTVGVASGYSIPSDTKQGQWDAKYSKPSGGIPDSDIASASTWNAKQDALATQTAYSAKGSATKVPQITTNSLGQVTGITEITITQPVVNNATLTIQKNGTTLDTFTANSSTDKTVNISVPTSLNDITGGTINTAVTFNTNTNTTPFVIGRGSSRDNECVAMGIDDGCFYNTYTNDEINSAIRWTLTNTDTEGSDGSRATTHYMQLNSGTDGISLYLDNTAVSMNGHTHDDRYLKLSGGQMTGPLSWSGENALPQKDLQYVLGIDAFASGGQTGWQSKSSFLSGYAAESWVDNNYLAKTSFSNYVNDVTKNPTLPKNSPRNFVDGTLVSTDIDYSQSSGAAFYMEIKGDLYGNGQMFTQVHGYIYDNTIINYGVVNLSNVNITELIAMNIDGKLCFWWPRIGYWHSFSVEVYTSSGGDYHTNHVVSITDSADVTTATKRIDLATSLVNAINSSNISSQSVAYASNADTVDSKHASDFMPYAGNLNGSISGGSPASETKTYFVNNISTNTVTGAYNDAGTEYGFLFSKAPSGAYGTVLKWGYGDKYIRMLRYQGSSWQSDDWEKISAGYADSAGTSDYVWSHASSPDNAYVGGNLNVFHSWNQGGPGGSSYSTGFTIGGNPNDQNYGWQMAQPLWNDNLYYRRYDAANMGGFGSWKQILIPETGVERLPWWNGEDSHSVNDLGSGITFAYSSHGAPTTGTIVSLAGVGSNCEAYRLQIQGGYYDNSFRFRNRNGDAGSWNDWREVIHSGNIGSQSVNYASSSGNADTVDNKHASDFISHQITYSDIGVDNLQTGITESYASQTGQYGNNHSVYMYFNNVGTPFQLQIPDADEGYIYKRYYSSSTWSSWSKIKAGYADTAGSATDSTKVAKAGDTMTGVLNVYSTGSNRASIHLQSQADVPNDFYLGANGGDSWSITSRDSSENYNLWLYSTSCGIIAVADHTTGDITFNKKLFFEDPYHRISKEDGTTITRANGGTIAIPNGAGKGVAILADEAGAGSSDYGLLYVGSDGALLANSGDTGYILRINDKDTGTDILKVGQTGVESQFNGNTAVIGAFSIQNNNRVTMQYNSTEDCLDFIFS